MRGAARFLRNGVGPPTYRASIPLRKRRAACRSHTNIRVERSNRSRARRLRQAECWSRRLETGERLRIVDLEGQQAVDFLCYSAGLPLDRLNVPNTVKLNRSLYVTKGNKLYSDHAKTLFTVIEDTCGFHDTLAGCCSNEMDELRYGVVKTQSCRSNFVAELSKWALAPSEIVSNINFFMRVAFDAQGQVAIELQFTDRMRRGRVARREKCRCLPYCRTVRSRTIRRRASSRHRYTSALPASQK